MDRAPLVRALRIALAAVTWVNGEWTRTATTSRTDRRHGVYGMPLPYHRRSNALSHRVEVSPISFVVDVALVFMVIAPVLVAVWKRVERARATPLARRAMLWSGVLACIAAGGWNLLWWWAVAMPVWSIAHTYWFRENEWIDRQRAH